jgi:hypothetical protein
MDQAVRLTGQHWCRGHRRRLAVSVALDRQIKNQQEMQKYHSQRRLKEDYPFIVFLSCTVM